MVRACTGAGASPLVRGRGSKHRTPAKGNDRRRSPLGGAWIETAKYFERVSREVTEFRRASLGAVVVEMRQVRRIEVATDQA
jgi:hypothetical protein